MMWATMLLVSKAGVTIDMGVATVVLGTGDGRIQFHCALTYSEWKDKGPPPLVGSLFPSA